MTAIRHHRIALLFALLSCVIPTLTKVGAEAYPDRKYYLNTRDRRSGESIFIDETSAKKSGMYLGYTVHERVLALVRLLGFVLCLFAFFIGRAGINGPYGKNRDISLLAAVIAMCSSALYAGWPTSFVLFLVFISRLQKKYRATDEITDPPAIRGNVGN